MVWALLITSDYFVPHFEGHMSKHRRSVRHLSVLDRTHLNDSTDMRSSQFVLSRYTSPGLLMVQEGKPQKSIRKPDVESFALIIPPS